LPPDAGELKQRIDVLEHENQRLSTTNELVKPDINKVSDCYSKLNKGITNRERELAKRRRKSEQRSRKQSHLRRQGQI
jgi:cell division protein ZapA (FtsZ GTPase activity inhibitor)